MKKLYKMISFTLAMLFCFSALNITAFAYDETLAEEYSSAPEVTTEAPCPMRYDEATYEYSEDAGVATFTPETDGVYYIFSECDYDTVATLYNGVTGEIISDGYTEDGYELNFLYKVYLEAGVTYVIKVDRGDFTSETAFNFNLSVQSELQIKLMLKQLSSLDLSDKMINLTFIVDSTGSMQDEIDAVKAQLQEFVGIIGTTKAAMRISLIDYRDVIEDYDGYNTTVIHYAPGGSIWWETKESSKLQDEIGNVIADGGGNYEESVIDAMGYLVNNDVMHYNENSAKFAFLITDATSRSENRHDIKDLDELTARLRENGIVTTVITEKDCYDHYANLAYSTGGRLLNINTNFKDALMVFAKRIIEYTTVYELDASITRVMGILNGNVSIPLGKVKTIIPDIRPFNATYKNAIFEVEDESVAQIEYESESKLVITGKKAGTTDVTVTTKDGGYVKTFKLTVSDYVATDGSYETCDFDAFVSRVSAGAERDFTYYSDILGELNISAEAQAEIFAAIRGTRKTVTFVKDDDEGELDYSWTFDGTDFTDDEDIIEFNSDVEIDDTDYDYDEEEEAAAEMTAKAELEKYTTIDFKHSGDLPGKKTTVSVALEDYIDGEYTLYYYNPETGELEDIGPAEVYGDIATFEITHCSTYVVGADKADYEKIKEAAKEKEDDKTKDDGEAPVKPDDSKTTSNNAVTDATSADKASETVTEKEGKIKITLKKVKVKRKAKKLVISATFKKDGKPIKNKRVTFKFNGKKYTAKTNKKGVAKITIKKKTLRKLKKGKKITYSASYNGKTVKKTVKVK